MSAKKPLSILHYLSLEKIGGVERYFGGFLAHRSERYEVRHGVMLREPMHPLFRDTVARHAESVHYRKKLGGVKIPRLPRSLRTRHQVRVARRHAPGVALIWNLLGDVEALETARAGGLVTTYWERGLAWFDFMGEEKIRAFLGGVDAVIANSHAGRRMLELAWGYEGPVEVHRNALRADAPTPRRTPKPFPAGRPFRVAVVGRLLPFKGVSLAVHAIAALVREGLDVELRIAGCGQLENELAALVSRLAMQGHAKLLGEVADVDDFLDRVDLLLHPALREPCSNVVIEAMARGCPVIAGRVDGMPELVRDGETGVLLTPELPLSEYARLGAHSGKLPALVYDPAQDAVVEPRLVDPAKLADAVRGFLMDPGRFEAFSAAAAAHVRAEFEPVARLEGVLASLDGFAARSVVRGAPDELRPAPPGGAQRPLPAPGAGPFDVPEGDELLAESHGQGTPPAPDA